MNAEPAEIATARAPVVCLGNRIGGDFLFPGPYISDSRYNLSLWQVFRINTSSRLAGPFVVSCSPHDIES